VFKKLDILIIKSFIGPFIATFLISLFVLIMQFFWLYIDDLVGKGIEINTIFKLLLYVSINMVPLALPLALLLSSIMTFGNLGETFEIVAIKSAGIPLLRFMRPLFIVTIFISGIAFLFSNNIIPVAQLRLATMKYNIIVSKPSFDIKEGVFYNKIDGYVIKLGKKTNDSIIQNIVIYERNYGLQDHLLIASNGVMRVTADKLFLEFILYNGNRYQEKGDRYTTNTEFVQLSFKEYKKVFDLKSFNKANAKDSSFMYDPKMLSVRQLNKAIDSLQNIDSFYFKKAKNEIAPYITHVKFKDSNWTNAKAPLTKAGVFEKSIPDSFKANIYDRSINQISGIKNNVRNVADDYVRREGVMRLHEIEWHRKFTLSVACLVLFLIGAPLGSIIRKGGLGTPLLFAIVFFVLFHLLNTFGEKFSREGVTNVFGGMWLSTLILIPVGFFLTYKAMRDSQLFNKEAYFRLFKLLKIGIQKILYTKNKTLGEA
jgi:lipopolysaccharide export system permease protein